MVTAEAAVVLPVLVVVLVALIYVVSVASGQLRCIDAARLAARAVARGEQLGLAERAAAQAAPAGARVEVVDSGGEVRVLVRAVLEPPAGLRRLVPGTDVAATATAAHEPDAGAP